ncbi:MAG: glucose-1-phosphate cytidylyltransferase [Phycisphaeraceae bacterium]|nr:glucose-1-phosphate cytidylyltransferase [Phycisphaeraceae bacterium]
MPHDERTPTLTGGGAPQAVILAGGMGTRLSEETERIPKPMVAIGGRPILWHIMKTYSAHGVTDFVICLGYKAYHIKEYFHNYFLHGCDVTFDLQQRSMQVHNDRSEPWRVTLIDTGMETMTGGRLKRVRRHLRGTFFMTYGDGLADVDISASLAFHRGHGRMATVTAVNPPGRFGVLEIDQGRVAQIREKPERGDAWINGGFFVLEPEALDEIDGDHTSWEREPMQRLAAKDHLRAFEHAGFWQPMDTLREKMLLEDLWARGDAPWRVWKD